MEVSVSHEGVTCSKVSTRSRHVVLLTPITVGNSTLLLKGLTDPTSLYSDLRKLGSCFVHLFTEETEGRKISLL